MHMSSGWLTWRWYLIQMSTANSLCHPDDILFHFMSSGWLNWGWFLIRMSYGNVIMSSGWDTLPFLSHPDEIANLDFPQHAVALQRFRNLQFSTRAPLNSSLIRPMRFSRDGPAPVKMRRTLVISYLLTRGLDSNARISVGGMWITVG